MVDLWGPGAFGAADAAATRPLYTPTNGPGDPDTFYQDCSSPAEDDGTEWKSAALNMLLTQMRRVVRGSTLTDSNIDDDLLLKAIRRLIVTDGSIAGRTQVFTAAGSFIVPATQLEIWGIGAGGAGGCSGDGSGSGLAGNVGGGGGAGAFGYKRISGLTIGSTISVTIGAGGVPSTANPSGGGGSTSFGPHMTCGGGAGGAYGVTTSGSGGAGGTASGADVTVAGGAGGFAGPNVGGTPNYNDIVRIYGRGGMAPGGWGTVSWSGTGSAGQGYGSGGSGASGGSLVLGGAGAPGLLIVRW